MTVFYYYLLFYYGQNNCGLIHHSSDMATSCGGSVVGGGGSGGAWGGGWGVGGAGYWQGYCSDSVANAIVFNQKSAPLREHYYVVTQIPAVSVDAIVTANIPAYWFKSAADSLLVSTCGDVN